MKTWESKTWKAGVSMFINLLTISRIIISVAVFLRLSYFDLLLISLWASASDFLDGFLARKLNLTSKLGATLDQLADKFYHGAMLLYFLHESLVHSFFVFLFLLRELSIVLLRYWNVGSNISSLFGKLKTAAVYLFILYILLAKNQGIDLTATIHMQWITSGEILILAMAYLSLVYSMRDQRNRAK